MKILIVGGAGYLGGAITDILQDTDHQVMVYDSLVFEEAYRKEVPFTLGDIRDREQLGAWLRWADCVIWLAGIVGDGACAINPGLSKEINQDSVKWLADNFNGRIIFPSTCSVYGAQDGLLTENSPTNPLSVYASTKLAAEDYLMDKNAIILRLGTLFGVGDEFSRIRLDLVVNTMSARAIGEGELKVFGGEQYRPLLHVRDVAKFMVQSLASDHTGVYNLHFKNMKMLELAHKVTDVILADIDVVDTTFEDSRNYKVNSDKARAIGFNPTITVEEGVEEIEDVYYRIKDINNPRYSNHGYLKIVGAE